MRTMRTMRTMSFVGMIMSSLIALGGCGASKTINTQDRTAIESVDVARQVKMPDAPMVIGSEAGLSVLFGAAGTVAAADTQKAGGRNFADFLKASRIDVPEIVRDQFTQQVKGDPFYGPRLSVDGRYHFVLEVGAYGIVKTNTLSSRWTPILGIRYRLMSPDGKILAENSAMTPMFSNLPTFTAEEINADPQLLKQAFEKAAAQVVATLIHN